MSSTESTAFVDEQWRGYDFRAAVPPFVLATLLTIALLAGRIFFSELTDALLTVLVVLVLWPALLFVAIYRAVTYTYRITNRALLVDRGFLHRPVLPIPYQEIARVEHGGNRIHAWLGIGWVRVETTDGRVVLMVSLRGPAAFSELLLERARLARQSAAEA